VIAESLLRRMLEELGLGHEIEVHSGGIAAYARDGALVSLDARLVLRDEGIEISADSVATDLKRNRNLIEASDLILAMTDQQTRMLADHFPESLGKEVYTLRAFAGLSGDIDDPAGQSEEVFAARRDEIKICLTRAIPRLLPI